MKVVTVVINRGQLGKPIKEDGIKTISHLKRSDVPIVDVGKAFLGMHRHNPATTLGVGAVIFNAHPVEIKGEKPFWVLAKPDDKSRGSKTILVKIDSEIPVRLEQGKAEVIVADQRKQDFLVKIPVDKFITIRDDKENAKVGFVLYNENGEIKKAKSLVELCKTEFGKRVILAPTVMTENVGEKTNAEQAGQKAA